MHEIKASQIKDKVINFLKIWNSLFVIMSEKKQSQDKLLATDFIIRGRKEYVLKEFALL